MLLHSVGRRIGTDSQVKIMKDLTQGSVSKVLLDFAVPFLVANVLQALYGGADLFMVGRFADSASVSAVAIGSQVMQTVTCIILGLTTGATVLTGTYVGAKDNRQIARTIGSVVWLFSIIAVALSLIMTLLSGRLVELMQTPPEAVEQTRNYIFICSIGVIFIVGYNAVCGILRGMGDSRAPLLFVAVACLTNIVLDFIFVNLFSMAATGAAIATVCAQGLSFGVALRFIYKRGFAFEFNRSDIRLHGDKCRKILMLGSPIAMQDALVNVSFLIITVIVNRMGVVASASLGVVEKLIVFTMLPTVAMASAVAAMTAQNYGAGRLDRARKCLSAGINMSLILGTTVFIYAQFLPDTLTSIFTTDPRVVTMASSYLRTYSSDCILVCFVFCMNAFFSGQGKSLFAMAHSLFATFILRIPLSFLFGSMTGDSLALMGLAAPISTGTSILICYGYLYRDSWMGAGRRLSGIR